MAKYKVFLSPGHSTQDPGAVSGGMTEFALCERIARQVAVNLIKNHVEVYHHVATEKYPHYVNDKVTRANTFKADFAVEIGMDASLNKNITGISTVMFANDLIHQKIHGIITSTLRSKLSVRPLIVKNIGFVRDTKMPATYIECGFITNDHDRTLARGEYVVLGSLLAKAIMEVLNQIKPQPKTTVKKPAPKKKGSKC